MIPRCVALLISLALIVGLVPLAWSQNSSPVQTIGERLGLFGRSRSSTSSAPSRQGNTEKPTTAAAASTENHGAFPQVDARSLLPGNLFGRRTDGRSSGSSVGEPASSSQRTGVPQPHVLDGEPRTATFPRGGSALDGGQGVTLPGLGGSPLPPSLQQAEDNTSGFTRSTTPTVTRARNGARTDARQSPERRNPVQFDPDELRRELAGSFPTPSTGGPAAATDEETQVTSDVGPSSNDTEEIQGGLEPDSGETIFSLPVQGGRTGRQELGQSGMDNFGQQVTTTTVNETVLAANQAPIITTDIRGPKQILIGREATFRVRLRNQGDLAAEGILAVVHVPPGAEVVGATTTSGTIDEGTTSHEVGQDVFSVTSAAAASDSQSKGVRWQVSRLAARSSESLDLRLVPRDSQPLELVITWTLAPIGSRAVVEVQEPKLEMHVSGPDEVLFGKPQLYRFTLSNPGTGVAQNVKLDLFSPGGPDEAVSTNPLGDLLPGTSQTIEVELVARDAGKLTVKATASAAGALSADATKEVFCRKPELSVDWRGPEMNYAGTDAAYYFRVRNPGTARADEVTVRVALPEGAEFVDSSEGQVYDARRREVVWHVGSLGPGDDHYMELKCKLATPGMNQLRIAATNGAGDLSDTKVAETNVVALADLKLEVSDPSGPVAVGEEAVYLIRVINRGASSARNVNVVAFFSAGVEPEQVEGGLYSVSDGCVSFRTIDELQVGKQAELRIRARALEPGTHLFRAEVLCRDLDIKLAAEETTRFYINEGAPAEQAGSTPRPDDVGADPVGQHGDESGPARWAEDGEATAQRY